MAVVIAGGAWGWSWYTDGQTESVFLDHAQRGQGALGAVERPSNAGRGHSVAGASLSYNSDTPTSGIHDSNWIRPGVYQTVQQRGKLVHALEHGLIVVYYDKPGTEVLETLTAWAKLYSAPWSGVVLTQKPGLGETLILTAWNRLFRLERFDAAAAAAFIDAFRGRGPEKPVR